LACRALAPAAGKRAAATARDAKRHLGPSQLRTFVVHVLVTIDLSSLEIKPVRGGT
jgi:hypothetical protein